MHYGRHADGDSGAQSDGYACDFNDAKYNVAQVPHVDSYRGFIFATLNPDAPSLIDYLISESRVDGTRFLSGWCGHRFVQIADRWQIQVRQVNLIDCDRNLRNPSIVL
jgi:phenylpropionate dioxygenase-like ring-hydroxylating dioxygenase large terminal subunit